MFVLSVDSTQEVVLAQQLVICNETVIYDVRFIIELYDRAKPVAFETLGYVQIRKACTAIHKPARKDRSTPYMLYYFGDGRLCGHIQDHIYSLIALCNAGDMFEVDYSMSVERLMHQSLSTCRDSLCLCCVAMTVKALSISANTSIGDSLIHAEIVCIEREGRRVDPIDLCSAVSATGLCQNGGRTMSPTSCAYRKYASGRWATYSWLVLHGAKVNREPIHSHRKLPGLDGRPPITTMRLLICRATG